MTEVDSTKEDPKVVSAQLRGETIAYAVQNGVTNLAGNFIEPYISYQVQKKYSHYNHSQHGNYTQNLAGEFAGDLAGAATLIAAELICPNTLHSCTRAVRRWIDPLYTSVAHAVLAKERDAPDYEQKIDTWKTFQERNVVRSAIMLVTGISANLATQKFIVKNPSPTKVIFLGNLVSSSLTTAIGLCARLAFPVQAKGLDNWMGKKIAPWVEDKRLSDDAPASHTSYLEGHRGAELMAPSR